MKYVIYLAAVFSFALISGFLSAAPLQVRTLENPPLEYMLDGEVTGVAVDLTREALRRTGHAAQIEIRPWKRALYEVAEGQADIAINTGRSDEREAWGIFPDEALINETFVLFSSIPMSLPKDLSGIEHFSLGNQLGYFYGERFHTKVTNDRFRSVETTLTIEKNLEKLVAKRIDLFIGDLLPTRYYIRQLDFGDDVHIVLEEGTDQPLVVSISPTFAAFSRKTVSPEFVKRFSEALKKMKEDGSYSQIVDSYLNDL
ncbi:MAG: transporter substrate-binding domain-containing protein [Marinobacter sp.]|uniref:substrate-binding periplasmic protein n=1 Tax=Marinobacter sp. TaxID=50741 RepID=UPI0034A09A40